MLRRIPTALKSESPNVVPLKPNDARTGSKIAGKKLIKIPLANDPTTAPLLPPVAFPNTPAAAPVKKCGTRPGTIILRPNRGKKNIEMRPAIKLEKNPMTTALGANGNTVGQSRAGMAFGTALSAIPLNAGTISAKSIRTPASTTYTPAAKVIA